MLRINWRVRLLNKDFWLAIIPAALLLLSQVMGMFGITLDVTKFQAAILEIVATIFLILTILGIINDPTTEGLDDSKQAMTYEEPKES